MLKTAPYISNLTLDQDEEIIQHYFENSMSFEYTILFTSKYRLISHVKSKTNYQANAKTFTLPWFKAHDYQIVKMATS